MSEIGINDQCFGVEVEMTGITRRQAADALAEYFGTTPQYLGTYYDTWGVTDPEGKVWKLMSDGSIRPERKTAEGYTFDFPRNMGSGEYQVEIVNAKQKMSIFAEIECHFSAVSIAVYTALIHHFTCRLEACQALIYQLVSGLTGENGKYNYSIAVHVYPPFFDIPCSAKNYKIAPALTSIKRRPGTAAK